MLEVPISLWGNRRQFSASLRPQPNEAELVGVAGASASVLCEEEEFNHIGINLVSSQDFQTLIINVSIDLHLTIAVFHGNSFLVPF